MPNIKSIVGEFLVRSHHPYRWIRIVPTLWIIGFGWHPAPKMWVVAFGPLRLEVRP